MNEWERDRQKEIQKVFNNKKKDITDETYIDVHANKHQTQNVHSLAREQKAFQH